VPGDAPVADLEQVHLPPAQRPAGGSDAEELAGMHAGDRRVRGKPLPVAGDRLIPGRQAAERVEGRLTVPGELGYPGPGRAGPVVGEAGSEGRLDVGAGGIAAPRPLVGVQRGQMFRRDRHQAPR
jgi:hypothetical protein